VPAASSIDIQEQAARPIPLALQRATVLVRLCRSGG
jgi:hypothetical protein